MQFRALVALTAMIVFAFFGTFLMHGVGGSWLILQSIPSEDSPFILAGAVCLLAAAYAGVVLLRVNSAGSWKKLTIVTSLGIAIVVLSPFIPFPVGCNLDTWFNPTNVHHGCPAAPIGTWSTIWPNVLSLDLGLVFASIGLGSAKPDRSPVVGAGMGLIMRGLVLIAFGSSFSYMTMCPLNGCPPLTSAQWRSLFWPDVLAGVVGAGQVVAGIVACIIVRLRRKAARSVVATVAIPEMPLRGAVNPLLTAKSSFAFFLF
jgi:hypothetical protein